MKYLVPILFILFVGCTKKIYVPVNSYHTITETLHDTIIDVKLDVIRDSIITDDTISVLSNKYSKTTAKWSNNIGTRYFIFLPPSVAQRKLKPHMKKQYTS